MKLKYFADLVTVVVGIAVLAILLVRFSDRPAAPQRMPDTLPEMSDPLQIDASAGIHFDLAQRTLILVLQSDCPFCQQSLPFYERLARRDRTGVQVVVAAPLGDDEIENQVSSIEPDSVVLVAPASLPVSSTPTLLLVDKEGLVKSVWVGLLDPERQEEVVQTVFGS